MARNFANECERAPQKTLNYNTYNRRVENQVMFALGWGEHMLLLLLLVILLQQLSSEMHITQRHD